ncbi:MAG: hypothetical protein E6Q40_09630 [Cupriavidus sp.]|nr:MAG: hypothetical protein E6Q40_09630 [Cupriavidus sp.]
MSEEQKTEDGNEQSRACETGEANAAKDTKGNLDRSEAAIYLVYSNEHKAWWRPDGKGYTTFVESAGRYTFEEASAICSGNRRSASRPGDPPPEVMVCAPEVAGKLAAALWSEQKLSPMAGEYLQGIHGLRAKVERLRDALNELFFAHENADETGYVADVGFLDLAAIEKKCREVLAEVTGHPVKAEDDLCREDQRKEHVMSEEQKTEDGNEQSRACETGEANAAKDTKGSLCYSNDREFFRFDTLDEAVEDLWESGEFKARDVVTIREGREKGFRASDFAPDVVEHMKDQAWDRVSDCADSWSFSDEKAKALQAIVEKAIDDWADANMMHPRFAEMEESREIRVVFIDDEGRFIEEPFTP